MLSTAVVIYFSHTLGRIPTVTKKLQIQYRRPSHTDVGIVLQSCESSLALGKAPRTHGSDDAEADADGQRDSHGIAPCEFMEQALQVGHLVRAVMDKCGAGERQSGAEG